MIGGESYTPLASRLSRHCWPDPSLHSNGGGSRIDKGLMLLLRPTPWAAKRAAVASSSYGPKGTVSNETGCLLSSQIYFMDLK